MIPTPSPAPADPTLEVAERQLAMLGELAQIAMAAARAFGASALAAAQAEERILADEYFMPEVGRARACGARDAAESIQKVSRAVRLTLKLEMAVAEVVRDIRAGVVPAARSKDAGGTPAFLESDCVLVRRPLAGSCPDDRDRDRCDCDSERLVEFERDDVLKFLLPPSPEVGRAQPRLQAASRVGKRRSDGNAGESSKDDNPENLAGPPPRSPAERASRPPHLGGGREVVDALALTAPTHPPTHAAVCPPPRMPP